MNAGRYHLAAELAPRGQHSFNISDWSGDGPNQNLHGQLGTKTQTRSTDLQQAGAARLENLQPTTGSNPQFGQPAHPARVPMNLGHVRPNTRGKPLNWKEFGGIHLITSAEKLSRPFGLLRLNLSIIYFYSSAMSSTILEFFVHI